MRDERWEMGVGRQGEGGDWGGGSVTAKWHFQTQNFDKIFLNLSKFWEINAWIFAK